MLGLCLGVWSFTQIFYSEILLKGILITIMDTWKQYKSANKKNKKNQLDINKRQTAWSGEY